MYIPIECTPISGVSSAGQLYQSDVDAGEEQAAERALQKPSSDFRMLKSLQALALCPYRLNFSAHEVLGGVNSLEPEGSVARGDT